MRATDDIRAIASREWSNPDSEIYAAFDRLDATIAAKDRRIAELEALADNYKDALRSIAIYDQDDRPLEYTKDDPYDWRRRSMKQEGMARAACNGTWPPMPATKEPPHA